MGLLVLAAGPPALYGPGPHWIDRVTGGRARVAAEATVDLDVNFDGAADLTVALAGTTEVARSAAAGAGRHRTHVDLEMVAFTLAGELPGVGPISLRAGDGIGNLTADGPLYSAGASDEVPGAPRFADDVFDIRFRVMLPGGVVLHASTPLRVTARIDRLPPVGARFTFTGPPLPLRNAAGTPVLQVVAAANTVVRPAPRPCDPAADGADVDAAASEIASRCRCRRACTARTLRTRIRSGLMNPDCRRGARAAARTRCAV
jgi:hypothetical protein